MARESRAFQRFLLFLLLMWATILSLPEIVYGLAKRLFSYAGEKDLTGKIVLITGSGKGLGREMAFQFAKNGCRVICVDVDEKANQETRREIDAMSGDDVTAGAYTCDVGDVQAVNELANAVLDDYGHVDILVINAGLIYGRPILEEEESMTKKVIDVNQMSGYWMVKSFLPRMKERKNGHIVFINSIASLAALGDAVIYSVTKYALLGLALSLADEFSRDGACSNIKISSVHPYFIATGGLLADPRALGIRAMKAEKAAGQIVTGVKREYFLFTVPGFELGYHLLSFSRFIPLPIYRRMSKLLRSRVLDNGKS